jgi:hypothetical protein
MTDMPRIGFFSVAFLVEWPSRPRTLESLAAGRRSHRNRRDNKCRSRKGIAPSSRHSEKSLARTTLRGTRPDVSKDTPVRCCGLSVVAEFRYRPRNFSMQIWKSSCHFSAGMTKAGWAQPRHGNSSNGPANPEPCRAKSDARDAKSDAIHARPYCRFAGSEPIHANSGNGPAKTWVATCSPDRHAQNQYPSSEIPHPPFAQPLRRLARNGGEIARPGPELADHGRDIARHDHGFAHLGPEFARHGSGIAQLATHFRGMNPGTRDLPCDLRGPISERVESLHATYRMKPPAWILMHTPSCPTHGTLQVIPIARRNGRRTVRPQHAHERQSGASRNTRQQWWGWWT